MSVSASKIIAYGINLTPIKDDIELMPLYRSEKFDIISDMEDELLYFGIMIEEFDEYDTEAISLSSLSALNDKCRKQYKSDLLTDLHDAGIPYKQQDIELSILMYVS
ncbi:MAG: hypothetical protein HRS57_02165 [Mycoplasmataceae bacterium]|nr:hypothetical protein [Mycoplasmataceae bacterium]